MDEVCITNGIDEKCVLTVYRRNLKEKRYLGRKRYRLDDAIKTDI
jgi:hypothetical protein